MVGDVKVADPIGSDPAKVGTRGAHVGMGNTHPDLTYMRDAWTRAAWAEGGRGFLAGDGGWAEACYMSPMSGAYVYSRSPMSS